MYRIETDGPAKEQVDGLPSEALAAYAELRVLLETAPWSGRAYHRGKPQAAMRAQAFGSHGLAVYVILEEELRVDVLLVIWAG